MDRARQLEELIGMLIAEDGRRAGDIDIPEDEGALYDLWRSLVNVREPRQATPDYLRAEDAFLESELARKGVVDVPQPTRSTATGGPGLVIWRGDITRLATDAIVNAANSRLLGCFEPCHDCIDNSIHTAAGVRLRLACAELMDAQGAPEPTGRAKVTPAFNLPSRLVIHTVGPIVSDGRATRRDEELLASCYESCLDAAAKHHAESIAFCSISTGVFGFPKRRAAEIAVRTVRGWCAERAADDRRDGDDSHSPGGHAPQTVVFDVFSEADEQIYRELLESL